MLQPRQAAEAELIELWKANAAFELGRARHAGQLRAGHSKILAPRSICRCLLAAIEGRHQPIRAATRSPPRWCFVDGLPATQFHYRKNGGRASSITAALDDLLAIVRYASPFSALVQVKGRRGELRVRRQGEHPLHRWSREMAGRGDDRWGQGPALGGDWDLA